jgi:hypothetical protein
VWPGLFTSRIGSGANSWEADDIVGQVDLTRAAGATGHIHFSIAALAQDRRGIAQRLRTAYANPALVPATPWLANRPPAAPTVNAAVDPNGIRLTTTNAGPPWLLATWALYGDAWRFFVLARGEGTIPREHAGNQLRDLVVSSVDRAGVESARMRVRLP